MAQPTSQILIHTPLPDIECEHCSMHFALVPAVLVENDDDSRLEVIGTADKAKFCPFCGTKQSWWAKMEDEYAEAYRSHNPQ